jgi:chemotaxis protein histidine kinase CheA
VAKTLEGVNDAASRNQQTTAAAEQTEKSRTVIRSSIRTLRVELDKLEVDFRATPELQRYYIRLAGVASGAASAEDQAGANQFDRSGRTLLDVINRLTDVLLEMRQ